MHNVFTLGLSGLLNTTGTFVLSTIRNTCILCLQDLRCGGTENHIVMLHGMFDQNRLRYKPDYNPYYA
jgi:hypothetical protein